MKTAILEPGKFYHIYNRAKNGNPLFPEEEDIQFFIRLYKTHVTPFAETWAYCILDDHVHFLVRMKEDLEGNPYTPFALLFNAYTKGYHTKNGGDGQLFKFKLKRIEIRRETILREVIRYINQNARRHGVVEDCSRYRYSSFHATVTTWQTLIPKEEILRRFGNREVLSQILTEPVEEKGLKMYLLEE
ncbi:MAG: hypothetical protein IH596_10800 [Bacteroidales bacterium]|nr:hypothetical protein [Bacteroidales bacterium]